MLAGLSALLVWSAASLPGPSHAKRRSSTSCDWRCSSRPRSSGSRMRRAAGGALARRRPCGLRRCDGRRHRAEAARGKHGRVHRITPLLADQLRERRRSAVGCRCRRSSRSRRPSRFARSFGSAWPVCSISARGRAHGPKSRRSDCACSGAGRLSRDRTRPRPLRAHLLSIVAPVAAIAPRMVGTDPVSAGALRDRGWAASSPRSLPQHSWLAMLDRRQRFPFRGREARVALAMWALVLIVAAGGFVATSGRPDTWVADRWDEFTGANAARQSGSDATHFGTGVSNRYDWRVAWRTFEDDPIEGVGAGAFSVPWFRPVRSTRTSPTRTPGRPVPWPRQAWSDWHWRPWSFLFPLAGSDKRARGQEHGQSPWSGWAAACIS